MQPATAAFHAARRHRRHRAGRACDGPGAGRARRAGADAERVPVKETDAYPKSMGFRIDTANVDKVKFPRHEVAQKCSECQLCSGKAGDPLGHLLVLQAPGAARRLVPQLQTKKAAA